MSIYSKICLFGLLQDVSFCKLQQLQCLHHGSTNASLCSPLCSEELEVKKNHSYKQRTHFKLATEVQALTVKHYIIIFCNGWIDCRDAFHAARCL